MVSSSLAAVLQTHFGLSMITDVVILEGGFRCLNRSLISQGTRYFLKQYRERESRHMMEAKRAEQWLAKQGLPIILPIQTSSGDSVFQCDEHWYSLYPFVEGKGISTDLLTPHHIASLGIMHAKLHRLGAGVDASAFSTYRFWDREVFDRYVALIEEHTDQHPPVVEEDVLALENIRLQKAFVSESNETPDSFGLSFDHLLIDDFIYTNAFFDECGNIEHLYDIERTGMGPRAYDLARSLFITCFDDGWDEKNFEFARTYMKAYQSVYPISKEEFRRGVEMYATRFMYMAWMEKSLLVDGSVRLRSLMRSSNARLHRFLGDRNALVFEIFVS